MSVIKNILYGLASGFSEFLPVSGRGHQTLLYHLFGFNSRLSLQDCLVHIGILIAVIVTCRDNLMRLRWEASVSKTVKRNKSRRMDTQLHYELQLLKSSIVPMLLGTVLFNLLVDSNYSLFSVMWLFLVNGVVLLIAEHTRQGNRDAKTMTGLDGVCIGLCTATSVLPGLSGTGMTLSYTTARGADIQKATNWVILLTIPTMLLAIGSDAIYIFRDGFGGLSFLSIIGSVLAGISAYCGGCIGISILRLMVANTTVFQFSYYTFGLALLSFILYLFT